MHIYIYIYRERETYTHTRILYLDPKFKANLKKSKKENDFDLYASGIIVCLFDVWDPK